MIIDLIEVLNNEEDPEEIILDPDPDLRGPKCNGSFGSGTLSTGNYLFFQASFFRNFPLMHFLHPTPPNENCVFPPLGIS
jgi:hypothetical protein